MQSRRQFQRSKRLQAVEDGQDVWRGGRFHWLKHESKMSPRCVRLFQQNSTFSGPRRVKTRRALLVGLFQQDLFNGRRWAGRPVSKFQRSKSLRRYRKRVQYGSKTQTQNRFKSTRTLSVGLFSTELLQRSKGSKRSNTSPIQQDSFTGTLSTIQDGQRSQTLRLFQGYFGV